MGNLEKELEKDADSNFPKDVKKYTHKDINLFKPSFYILNSEKCFDSYHFIVPTLQPPPLKVGKRVFILRENRIMAVNHGQTLKVDMKNPTDDSETPGFLKTKEYSALFINRELMQNVAYNACGKVDVQFYNDTNLVSKKIKDLLDQFSYEATAQQQGCSLMLDSISVQIIIQMMREIRNNVTNQGLEREYEGKSHVDIAIEFIREYYNSDINLDDLCKVTNLSPYHFIRIFKAETGKTPHAYLLDVKIEKAQELIRARQYSLNEIAHLSGFVKQSHFSTVFKKRTGITPLSFQKSLL